MDCPYSEICGGCPLRGLSLADYQSKKNSDFKKQINQLSQMNIKFGSPIFIGDGNRRRASLAFQYKKGKLVLGFNENKSSELVNCEQCCLLTSGLNAILPSLRILLENLCKEPFISGRGKKQIKTYLTSGDIWLCHADNGIDIVLEFSEELDLSHRMIIFEYAQTQDNIIRISHRQNSTQMAEPIIEKSKPIIHIADYDIYIPAATFLQPSKAGEQALISLVVKYVGENTGKIADLFCGVGTFSYPLSRIKGNKILAVDSSASLLKGFQQSINTNCITNIEINTKNLFKYPLDENELKGFDIVVFDPPRAGASAQIDKIISMPAIDKPHKIIAISCNPHTFINDADKLLKSGDYHLTEITLVDQFSYSTHSELVALFTKI